MSWKQANTKWLIYIAFLLLLISYLFLIKFTKVESKFIKISKVDTLEVSEDQERIIFPNSTLADSICGKQNRFTTQWCEIATN